MKQRTRTTGRLLLVSAVACTPAAVLLGTSGVGLAETGEPVSVAIGEDFVCAVLVDGSVECAGNNDNGHHTWRALTPATRRQ